jgi:curved DNA-binding protein CbpA
VQPDAPVEIIRASYRTQMRELKLHPDLGGTTRSAALLNEAYETLSDSSRRAAYDKELFGRYSKKTAAPDRMPLTTVFCPVCRRPAERNPQPGERCATCQSPLPSPKQTDSSPSRRRNFARSALDGPVFYFSSWPGKPRKAQAVDFTPEGMKFYCGEQLVPKSMLKISSRLFEAAAEVTYSRPESVDGKAVYAVGVRFLAVAFEESRGAFLSTSA